MNQNMKWILLGILSFILFVGFAFSIVFLVMKLMKGEAYELSLLEISNNRQVIEIIGEPIQPGWFVMGSVNTSGPEGSASLEYSIEGPNGSGKVYVYASRTVGEWKLDKVVVANVLNQQRINVVGGQ